jgi:eukaryotic-like serine/threonine-protein kinase
VAHAAQELADQLRTVGWEVGDQLAGSPQSVVYRARRLGGDYALKVMRDGLDCEAALRSFRREAAMAAAVGHPGLPEVYEVGRAGRWPYLAMELLGGPSLATALSGGPLTIDGTVDLALHLAQTLAAAHRVGMVHRDIKPDNVVFDAGGRPRLVDFGLAQVAAELSGSRVVGTLRYSSPEQGGMLKRPVDHRSDLYSLGVVLYECLTGSVPFAASDAGELLRAHAVLTPPPIRQLRGQTPPALAGIVATLLAKDPDDRYRSADGLVADLRRVAAGERDFALRSQDDRFGVRGEPPLIGAGGELATLLELWGERDQGGGTVLVGGGEGSGKSRLVRELAELARQDGCPVVTGRCRPDATPFAALREALDGYLRYVHRAGAEQGIAAARAAADAAAGLVAALSPKAARAIGREDAGAGADPDQFAAAVITFLTDLARRSGGLLLCLEDVHWLDGGSLQVLRRLSLELPDAPLVVACTGRGEPAGSLDRFRAAAGPLRADLMMPELTDDGVRRLIAAELGQPVDPVFARRLGDFARGNPFAVIESVRALVAGGHVSPFWGRSVVDETALDQLDLPVDVFDLVSRQVEQLGEGQLVLAAAAVIGDRFGLELLGVVSAAPAEQVVAALSDAVRKALVEPTSREGYRFTHGSVRQLLLDRMTLAQRRALHQRVAEALDRPGGAVATTAGRDASLPGRDRARVYELARHYARGEVERTPRRTFETCWAAGQVALGEHAVADAAGFLAEAERAATLAGMTPPTSFHATVGLARYAAGELDEAATRLTTALAGEQDPLGRVAVLDQLARVEYARPNYASAMNYSRQALAELGHPVPRNRLAALAASGWALARAVLKLSPWFGFGKASGAARQRELAHLQLAEPLGRAGYHMLPESISAVLGLRFFLAANRVGPSTEYVLGYLVAAMDSAIMRLHRISGWMLRRAADAAGRIGDPRLVARVAIAEGYAQTFRSDHLASADTLRTVLAEHGRWLPTEVYIEAAMALSALYSLRGYNREAEEWRLRAMERGARYPTMLNSSVVLGHTEEPEAQLRQVEMLLAADSAQAIGPLLWGGIVHSAANVLWERGEFGPEFDRVIEGFHRRGPTIRSVRLFFRRFWLTQAYGRLEQARLAAPAERAARLAMARDAVTDLGRLTGRLPVLLGHHRVAQAALDWLEGRYTAALDRLAEAERIADEHDAPWVRFEALVVRARVLRALRHLPAAATAAQAALLVAERHDWVYRAARARKELAGDPASSGGLSRSRGLGSTGSVADLRDRRYLNALLQVSTVASSVLDPRALARTALDELLKILGAERAYLFACTSDTGPLERYAGRDADGNDLDELVGYSSTVVERARVERRPFIVTGSDAGAAVGSQSAVAHGLRSIIVAPMQLEGRLLGVVYLDSTVAKGVFAAADEEILVAIANQIASSLETARAAQLEVQVEAERRQRELADQLREATGQLSRTLDPDEVLDRALHLAADIVGADAGCVLLVDRLQPRVAAVYGKAVVAAASAAADAAVHAPVAGLAAVGTGYGWLGDAALTVGSPVLLPPALAAPTELVSDADAGRLPDPLYLLLGRPLRWLALPLAARGDRFGVLMLAGGGLGSQPAAGIAAVFARQAAAAYDNARLFRQVEQLAITDGLTGIYNRRHFMELAARELAAAQRHRRPVAAIMLDIDHFKNVNDSYGHAAGDEVIRVVADRLTGGLRREDLLGRYGGEEFALLVRNDEIGAVALAERLRLSVQDAVVLTPDGPLHVTISVGVSMCLASDTSPEQVLARADAALYAAKQDGRNRVAVTAR